MRVKKTKAGAKAGANPAPRLSHKAAAPGVMGHRIAAPRPTWQAALLLALALSLPVFAVLSVIERWL